MSKEKRMKLNSLPREGENQKEAVGSTVVKGGQNDTAPPKTTPQGSPSTTVLSPLELEYALARPS